ncbi:hypothetical protein [Actinomadura gamaensis]|uniref:Uncharacterized protein n=1 Tax=Actinomadura gamaensis TaxID=1763541 RepID=A0ABV9UBA9_9ACTN
MGALVVLALLVVLSCCAYFGIGVADSRDSRDWKPSDWPSRRDREQRR